MERRGFFGALMGVLALPLVWRRYPPVVWLDVWPVCTQRPQPKMEGDGPHVFAYRSPEAATWDNWSSLRREIWNKRNEGKYFVTWEVHDCPAPGEMTSYLSKPIDHRPTWAEVRDVMRSHRAAGV